MTDYLKLKSVLRTYQDSAPNTLQGPASLSINHQLYASHQFHAKGMKRELDSSPPLSSDEDFKRHSPSPIQLINVPSGTVIERTDSRQISTPTSPPQPQPALQREVCASPVNFVQMSQPIMSQPILTAPDSEGGTLKECVLESKVIACFELGGELRLCMPQILNYILHDFPLDRIHRTIEDLQISCSKCTPEQEIKLKLAKILPQNVPPCGLITRTNAERLCSALLHSTERLSSLKSKMIKDANEFFKFRVYHRCFGKSEGFCYPALFSFTDRECIECIDCKGMLPPNKFILHVCKNKPKENRTCHWGFDSTKWRSYIHVALEETNMEKCTKMLDEICGREMEFENIEYVQRQRESNSLKRKAALEDANNVTTKQEPMEIPIKKTRIDDSVRYLMDIYNNPLFYQITQQFNRQQQQPWLGASPKHTITPFGQIVTSIPYLPPSQEPPILQNPERVVRHSESERFERTYQPNVALAPRQTILAKERERDFDKDRETTERSSSVIKCDIQIKQERPSTPINESPELRNNSPETTGDMELNGQSNDITPAAPISPESGRSGSNEITSSTSPVPATIPNKQESISPPPLSQASPNQTSSTSPRSHHILNQHHIAIHKTSPVVVKVSTNQPATFVNGTKSVPIIGNPEFELSTDTDEESLGEPDSSNLNGIQAQTALEYATLLLKTNTLEDRHRVLSLIKHLENEITLLKDKQKKIMEESQGREENLRKDIDRLQNQMNQQNNRSNVIANNCLSTSSSSSSSSLSSSSSYDYDRNERRNSIVEKPNVIIKPPKKSLQRITPLLLMDDCKSTANSPLVSTPSIVIMPKREDIINNNNTKLYNNNNPAPTSNTINGQTEMADDDLKKTIKVETNL